MPQYDGCFGNEDYNATPREDIVYGHDDDSGDIDLDGDPTEDEANFDDGDDD